VLLFHVVEFQLTILGVGILDLLWWVLDTERNVSFESGRVGKRVKTAVAHVEPLCLDLCATKLYMLVTRT